MRTTLFSMLVMLAQWGMPAYAQPPAGAQTARPADTNGYLTHQPTKRFFFTSDPKSVGRPEVFARPAQAPGTDGFRRSVFATNPVLQNPVDPALKFPPTGLRPLESVPSRNLWRFVRPKNSKLFFFTKP
jgi:hypothetical protein